MYGSKWVVNGRLVNVDEIQQRQKAETSCKTWQILNLMFIFITFEVSAIRYGEGPTKVLQEVLLDLKQHVMLVMLVMHVMLG